MESFIRTRYHYWLNRQVRQPKTSLARQQGGPAGGCKLTGTCPHSGMVSFTNLWSEWLSTF